MRPIVFSATARFVLGCIVAFLGFLVAGELHVDPQLRGAIAGLTALLAAVGVVPPKPSQLPEFLHSPRIGLVLTVVASGAAYAVTTFSMNPTVRGLIVAALALAGSVGIVPPQAETGVSVPRAVG